MNMRTTLLCSLSLLLPMALIGAESAYTWIDDNGTRHFSETPPIDESMTAEQIELLPAPSAGAIGGDNDFYSVANQADRMEKKRLANERLIAERLQAELEAKRAAPAAPSSPQTPAGQDTQEYSRYYPTAPLYTNKKEKPAQPQPALPWKTVEPVDIESVNPMSQGGH